MGNARSSRASPLKGVLRGMCELTYTGRRTSRTVALPVPYARDDDRLVVYVGRSNGKTWLRNFVESCPASVKVNGVDRQWTGRVVLQRAQAADIYRRRHSRVDFADEPLVVIGLTPSP